jgi:hypothetical protein
LLEVKFAVYDENSELPRMVFALSYAYVGYHTRKITSPVIPLTVLVKLPMLVIVF